MSVNPLLQAAYSGAKSGDMSGCLVYSDWLEERGDPTAAAWRFIASMPAYDRGPLVPTTADASAWSYLVVLAWSICVNFGYREESWLSLPANRDACFDPNRVTLAGDTISVSHYTPEGSNL